MPAEIAPAWVKDAVFYQIFPERFANGDPSNDPENVQPWGTPPTIHNFMGGDLQGVIDHLDYLEALGVTAIYFNPIFQASSNHKYNTYDYFRIDPHFGDLETFRRLRDACHRRGIRVILDGVFNHCGRGFYAFHDVLENGPHSPYRRWFHIERFPLYPYDESQPANYRAWWNIRSLPQFNIWHAPVRAYLLSVARYWLEQGIDGWRLDVPNEIADHEFWREFRRVVKRVNPEAYIVGEIWQDGTPWLDGTQFDGVMNYLLREICVDFFARDAMRADHFGQRIDALLRLYGPTITPGLLNLLGSHDTPRFVTLAGGDVARLKLALLFLCTYPGAPMIYYGDEIGLSGEGDPHCRACFPWDAARWNHDLLDWTRRCIALRREHAVLRHGAYLPLLADRSTNLYAFARRDHTSLAIVVLNNNAHALTLMRLPLTRLELPDGLPCTDRLSGRRYRVERAALSDILLPARGAAVLFAQPGGV
ncbi:glycoside hydrolase family 13 protein [Kallotenue papyrolyticum]|uniref:glycoside hydrolase family 13 protein n=1 Tax=Kallotenue papyrolyticum TaxID=1325125 RepID=UPI0004927E17|nr:glycoside hydrolase family 13 protein [Kallotenue papyrolyticum]